MYMLFMSWEPW